MEENNYDDVAGTVEESAINFTQNVVNDSIRKNAEFQYNAGFKARVVRYSSGSCCKWCDDLAGEYEYPHVPDEVYHRHANCRCTVEYEPSKGKRQDVWTKEWKELYSMGLHTFQEIAKEAGAVYHVKRMVLVNTEIADEYLENFRDDPV